MVMYASAADLASFLQQDVDTATAELALAKASALFSTRANTWFAPTSVTYQAEGTGNYQLWLPYRPIISVSAVRIAGVTVTDYTRIKRVLYRIAGFGLPGVFPPQLVEVDVTHGYAAVPDDVAAVVLETAAAAYMNPDVTMQAEAIDDYQIRTAPASGGFSLTASAAELADLYRGTLAA